MRKTLNIVLGTPASSFRPVAYDYLTTLICIQAKPGWRAVMMAVFIVALLMVPYGFGYNSGREQVIEAFDKRFDHICDALPWPRPAVCAKGVPDGATP